ncbi:MAG: TadE/TadG family type IV pilus assembly protein [Rhodopila sp.]|jgi:Flp pilus assembly protein TadG
MTICFSARSRRHSAGGATIEFAMTILAMLMIIFGVLQTGIMCWRWQALESAAIDAARCSGLGATSCPDSASTAIYAASVAQLRGLSSLTASNVTVTTGTSLAACGSTTVSVVSVALSYTNPLILWWGSSVTMTASACYPLSSG